MIFKFKNRMIETRLRELISDGTHNLDQLGLNEAKSRFGKKGNVLSSKSFCLVKHQLILLNRENTCKECLLLLYHTGREEEIAFSLLVSCLES